MLRNYYSGERKTIQARLKKMLAKFGEYEKKITRLNFSKLPWDDFSALEKPHPQKFKQIIIVGMGGSSLGAKALASAFNNRKVSFLDNVDSDFVAEKLKRINARQSLFLLVSKSGETIEVLSLASILLSKIAQKKNFIVITDDPESSLGALARKNKIPIFISPKNVPGRFSVLSVVGLLPAALADIPIARILNGAKQTRFKDAFALACHQYLHFADRKNITVFFPYSERLSCLGDWYIQLLAESIGKSSKIGITPTKALGVKDQHSQLQLFLDGPDDKFFIFLKPGRPDFDLKIPGKKYTLSELFDAEYAGVKKALIEREKPFVEISFPSITAETIGQLFFFFSLEVAFLGTLFKVNSSNQPAVELSKSATKKILNSL